MAAPSCSSPAAKVATARTPQAPASGARIRKPGFEGRQAEGNVPRRGARADTAVADEGCEAPDQPMHAPRLIVLKAPAEDGCIDLRAPRLGHGHDPRQRLGPRQAVQHRVRGPRRCRAVSWAPALGRGPRAARLKPFVHLAGAALAAEGARLPGELQAVLATLCETSFEVGQPGVETAREHRPGPCLGRRGRRGRRGRAPDRAAGERHLARGRQERLTRRPAALHLCVDEVSPGLRLDGDGSLGMAAGEGVVAGGPRRPRPRGVEADGAADAPR